MIVTGALMLYKNVLVALHGKKKEAEVIHEAVRLATALDAHLTVLHVNSPQAGKAHLMMGSLPLLNEAYLRDWFRQLGHEQMADAMSVVVLESESYAREIARVAEGYDLVIAGHRPKGSVTALLVDSTDERVLDQICCPVLVVPFGCK